MSPSTLFTSLQPGDVCAVHTPGKLIAPAIRLGAALQGLPHTVNHIVVVHHRVPGGQLIGVEANPSGVGWVDLAAAGYDNRWLLANTGQPKTDTQRATVTLAAEQMIRSPYDWGAIAYDALSAFGIRPRGDLWHGYSHTPPRWVDCSSFAAWLYRIAGLPDPGITDRWCTPGHWARFIQERGWLRVPAHSG